MTHDESKSDAQRAAGISKTAIWVAAARAIGALEPDPGTRNPDHLARQLLGDPSELDLDHPVVDALRASYDEAMRDMETRGHRPGDDGANAIHRRSARARDRRRSHAGADTRRGLRFARVPMPRAARADARLRGRSAGDAGFQEAPRRRGVRRPAAESDVRADRPQRRRACPTALARHGYDASQRTFVIMEGVTMYVPEEALRATFRFVASHAAGSSVVFDFATRTMIEGLKRIDLASIPRGCEAVVRALSEHDQRRAVAVRLSGRRREGMAGRGRPRAAASC